MKKKIIIIEDQLILNDMLKKTLASSFEVVATSDDASTMLNLCDKYSPDLVLTDICTKNNSSGISNGKKVKDKYGNKIKVLAITGIPEVSFLNEAKAANLDGFIYKNIESEFNKNIYFIAKNNGFYCNLQYFCNRRRKQNNPNGVVVFCWKVRKK